MIYYVLNSVCHEDVIARVKVDNKPSVSCCHTAHAHHRGGRRRRAIAAAPHHGAGLGQCRVMVQKRQLELAGDIAVRSVMHACEA